MNKEDFASQYIQLFFAWQKLQWENYAQTAGHDLNEIDAQFFKLYVTAQQGNCLQTEIAPIITRGLVDKHPLVARLRNEVDAIYDSPDLPKDRMKRQNILTVKLTSYVMELFHLRTELAKQQGFPSYVDLVLGTEGFEQAQVRSCIEDYLSHHLGMAKALIAKYQIKGGTWFKDVQKLGQLCVGDTKEVVAKFLLSLGYQNLLPHIQLTIKEQPINGYVGALDVPHDVRILVKPVDTLQQLSILYHELGHALSHLNNKGQGIYKTWVSVYDEAMAVVVEQIGIHTQLQGSIQQQATELRLLENVRLAISFLFELDLWQNPHQGASLYAHHYGKLGLTVDNPDAWVTDTFRSIDPVYVHSYILGAIVALKTITHLQNIFGENYGAWGQWLKRNYFCDGRRRTLQQKTRHIVAW